MCIALKATFISMTKFAIVHELKFFSHSRYEHPVVRATVLVST
ncbi:hypothetical protein AAKU67_000699 [Oxalobacteraceae bacterium GrIS 2.11]